MFEIPGIRYIIHNDSKRGDFFTVVWDDGTTTTIKRHEDDDNDEYTALLYAMGKKMFGNKGVARDLIADKKEQFDNERRRKASVKKKQMELIKSTRTPPKQDSKIKDLNLSAGSMFNRRRRR